MAENNGRHQTMFFLKFKIMIYTSKAHYLTSYVLFVQLKLTDSNKSTKQQFVVSEGILWKNIFF